MDFFLTSPIPSNHLVGTYNFYLVFLSYIVAVFASYIALDMTGYLQNENKKPAIVILIIAGAFAMGAGIWSMHFIGMLAFSIDGMKMEYDPFWTTFSLLVAIAASSFALFLLKDPIIKIRKLIYGGIAFGLAIASMHYTGMEGMKNHVNIAYRPDLFFLSVLIAILASEGAIWCAVNSNKASVSRHFSLKILSAFIMGAAICGMHYVGMEAAIFTPKIHPLRSDFYFNPNLLAVAVGSMTLLILFSAYFTSNYRALYRKKHQLEKTTDFLKNILESSIEYSIIALDMNGDILTWNEGARRNYGYEAEEMVGKENLTKLNPPRGNPQTSCQELLNIAKQKGKSEAQLIRLRKDGTEFTASVVITLLKNKMGLAVGYLLISKDITKQIYLEKLEKENKQILETNRLKSEFLANMSHEMRTPLNSVICFSELLYLETEGLLTKEQREFLQNITSSGKHLLHLIEDILDLVKIEAGKLELFPSKINVIKIIQKIVDYFSAEHPMKQIHVSVNDQVKELYLDPIRFEQIFYNLISNAIKFTSGDGQIFISVQEDTPTTFKAIIEDNGIGISPDEIAIIFHPFKQLDSSVSKKYPGTGLGLTLTKQIVEMQNGCIEIQSTQGKGTVVTITLPKYYQNEVSWSNQNIGKKLYPVS